MTKFKMTGYTEVRLKTLLPHVESVISQLLELCYESGINVQISCAYRSIEEQNMLYAIGRTKKGKIVTFAKGGQSEHQRRTAVDLFFLDAKGKASFDERLYARVWFIACSHGLDKYGLEWSGNWKKMKEMAHFQIPT